MADVELPDDPDEDVLNDPGLEEGEDVDVGVQEHEARPAATSFARVDIGWSCRVVAVAAWSRVCVVRGSTPVVLLIGAPIDWVRILTA